MITLTITGETMAEILGKIREYAPVMTDQAPQLPVNIPAIGPPAQAPAMLPPQQSAPLPPPAPAYSAPPPPPVPTVPAAPTFTLEQIMRAGSDLLTARPDLVPQLMAMPAKYGVQTLDRLKPEQFGAVATELRTLGAKI